MTDVAQLVLRSRNLVASMVRDQFPPPFVLFVPKSVDMFTLEYQPGKTMRDRLFEIPGVVDVRFTEGNVLYVSNDPNLVNDL